MLTCPLCTEITTDLFQLPKCCRTEACETCYFEHLYECPDCRYEFHKWEYADWSYDHYREREAVQ